MMTFSDFLPLIDVDTADVDLGDGFLLELVLDHLGWIIVQGLIITSSACLFSFTSSTKVTRPLK